MNVDLASLINKHKTEIPKIPRTGYGKPLETYSLKPVKTFLKALNIFCAINGDWPEKMQRIRWRCWADVNYIPSSERSNFRVNHCSMRQPGDLMTECGPSLTQISTSRKWKMVIGTQKCYICHAYHEISKIPGTGYGTFWKPVETFLKAQNIHRALW